MKVIDLLNKIANGEEVPHFIIDDLEHYIGADGYLKDTYGDKAEWWISKIFLNMEVEIIEDTPKEDKKIAKIGKLNQVSNDKQHLNNYILRNKLNEIIDKVNGENNDN